MTAIEHKQYLITSIQEMGQFIQRLERKIETDPNIFMSEERLQTIEGIIDRKRENIAAFKRILSEKYDYSI